MVAGVGVAVWSVIIGATRIVRALPNQDVAVPVHFSDTVVDVPIAADGGGVPVTLESGVVTVTGMPAASLISLVLHEVVLAGTIVTVVTTLLLLCRSILSGRIFGRTSTRLVSTASIGGFLGFAATPFFANMVANGAIASLSDRTFDNAVISADWAPLVLLGFISALATTVFRVGERLQRETEGLV